MIAVLALILKHDSMNKSQNEVNHSWLKEKEWKHFFSMIYFFQRMQY